MILTAIERKRRQRKRQWMITADCFVRNLWGCRLTPAPHSQAVERGCVDWEELNDVWNIQRQIQNLFV